MMKKVLLFLIMLTSFMMVSVAQNNEEINYFEVSDNIATPVKIVTNLGTFSIYGGERIDGHIFRCTPYDANGNLIVNNEAYSTEWGTNKPTIKYWRFSDIYESHSTNDDEGSSSSYRNRSGDSWGNKLGNTLGNYADRASKIECYGYPNFQIRAGYYRFFGEMLTAKVQWSGVGGFVIAGGIGQDFSLDHPGNPYSWYVAAGYYGGGAEGNDITFDVNLGKDQSHPNYFFAGFELEYSHFFSSAPHFGFYLGCSLEVGMRTDHNEEYKEAFGAGSFHVGISMRLF